MGCIQDLGRSLKLFGRWKKVSEGWAMQIAECTARLSVTSLKRTVRIEPPVFSTHEWVMNCSIAAGSHKAIE